MNETVVSCYHLTNQAANKNLEVIFDGKILTHDFELVYLGIKLDQSLIILNKHIAKLIAKLNTRINILRIVAGTSWGGNATCLRTSALALVYSVAEYCSSAWLTSAHAKKIDVILNQAMRIITGRLRTGHGRCNAMQWICSSSGTILTTLDVYVGNRLSDFIILNDIVNLHPFAIQWLKQLDL